VNNKTWLVEARNVKKSFGKVEALGGITLNLEANNQYAVKGTSGSGKSTLLYLLGGLDRPSGGEIFISGKNLSLQTDDELAKFRNQFVGFVFQFHFLLQSMTCMNNILLPGRIRGGSIVEIQKDTHNLAQILGVTHCLEKYPYQLSGGEQQRINIIRALSLRPKLLLCDEPTGNLDSKNTELVTSLLKELASDYQSTLIVVTHDNDVSSKFKNQIVLKDGKLFEVF